MKKSLISIVSPFYNEIDNVRELYGRVCKEISFHDRYDYEMVFIDNCSDDGTREVLREIADGDRRVKVILNTRNFGHIRSPYWAFIQARGDAVIYLASDLQDPPEFIGRFLEEWERGWKIALMVKPVSKTNKVMHWIRTSYYGLLDKISDVRIVRDATGFGIYDRIVLDEIRKINDPNPFLRGIICDLGYPVKTVEFTQPRRQRGISKNNFYTLYDVAMLGIISNSLLPLRLASFVGFGIAFLCMLISAGYLVTKILFWDQFPIGVAPLIIGVFFLFGLMFGFIGLLGEYIGSIHTYLKRRPIVVEEERINF